jgi:hypothetical protein
VKHAFMFMVICCLLPACAQQPQPQQISSYKQAELNDPKSLIGKQIWVTGRNLDPVICDALPCNRLEGSLRLNRDEQLGPLYVKDAILQGPFNDDLYVVVKTKDEQTKYLNFISDKPSQEVLFEDPKITAAREKAACDWKGPVSIGMTESKVIASCWGEPEKKNITQGVTGRHEQWVYDSGNNYNYLYFATAF